MKPRKSFIVKPVSRRMSVRLPLRYNNYFVGEMIQLSFIIFNYVAKKTSLKIAYNNILPVLWGGTLHNDYKEKSSKPAPGCWWPPRIGDQSWVIFLDTRNFQRSDPRSAHLKPGYLIARFQHTYGSVGIWSHSNFFDGIESLVFLENTNPPNFLVDG